VEQLEKQQTENLERFKVRTKELKGTVAKELQEATLDAAGTCIPCWFTVLPSPVFFSATCALLYGVTSEGTNLHTQRRSHAACFPTVSSHVCAGLRRLIQIKNKVLRQMKSLAATILDQRTETEQFFLEALQEVRRVCCSVHITV
jgi:hypothetical protein